MELHQLRYAVLLAQELHFSRASKKANISQPTLSQQIQKLEKELGSPLFERSPHRIRLTASGERFIPLALAALEAVKRSIESVSDSGEEAVGVVRVGVIPTICPYLIPDVLVGLSKTAPRVQVQLFEETTSILLENLKSGMLDMGILALPIADKGIATLPLRRERFYAAMHRSHPLAKHKQIGRKELLKEKLLILQEGHCFGQQSMEFCRIKRGDSQIHFQGSSLGSVLALASMGEGITFAPEMAVRKTSLSTLKFISLPDREAPFREIGAAWRLSAPLSRAQETFIREVERSLKISR